MMMEMGVKPDNFTYATILDTCANLARLGKQIHAQIIKYEMHSDAFTLSTLVDMRSGKVNEAIKLIQEMPLEADDVI
ncbi:hypothetical protein LguiB_009487 [Lonicera macranthoides]